MTALLDVNVLLALAWPNHVHHAPAQRWFSESHRQGWATCGVTESGFIRVSSNIRVTPDARTPAEAATLLHRMCSLDGHTFLVDTVSLAAAHVQVGSLAHSGSVVTHAHLILLASATSATFVTFDRQAASKASIVDVPCVLLTM